MTMRTLERSAPSISRAALAAIFIVTGLDKLADPASTGAFIAGTGLPFPTLLAAMAGLVEVLGGASLLLGLRARWGALALLAFLVPVTLMFHNPIGLSGPEAQQQTLNLLKNLAIAGGLLAIATSRPSRAH